MTTFRAMGTEVTLLAPGLEEGEEVALALRVAAAFETAERRFSRFRAESELSRLNRAAGAPARVSPELLDALVRARQWFDLTRGLFDPAVGGVLAALGYDRSFAPGALDRDAPAPAPPPLTLGDVVIDPRAGTVLVPPGATLDLGGLAKGLTVDAAAALLPVPAALDAGGDAVLRGDGPEGEGWLVDVEDPRDPARTLVALRLRERAVATSAPNRRRWRLGAGEAHHLVDPRTRRPARSDLLQVTAVAPTAELAEVLAKAAFLSGAREALRLVERVPGAGAVLVRDDGRLVVAGSVELAGA